MQDHDSPFDGPLEPREGVLVVDGYGIRLHVQHGRLQVEDGIGRRRRRAEFARATSGIRRLIVLGSEGAVTLAAVRWLADVGACLVHVGRDGRVLVASAPPGNDDPRLRRAQALSADSSGGMEIARDILSSKLGGQTTVLRSSGWEGAARLVDQEAGRLATAESLEVILQAESAAAVAYWEAWEGLPVRFARRDEKRIPEHWMAFGHRSSPITGGPRLAGDPANAILNYLYALLEAEARIACLAMGLDPGLGFFHRDQRNRDSLALDVMEAVRPDVDAYVLDLLSSQVFRAADFGETPRGVCRILPPLTHALGQTTRSWGVRAGRVVEWIAKALAGGRVQDLPTPLTQDNRSDANRRRGRGPRPSPEASHPVRPSPACHGCGVVLEGKDRLYCDPCEEKRRKELALPRFRKAQATLKRAREEGRDPAHGGEAARKRGRSISQRHRERAAWVTEPGQGYDETAFRRDILPALAGIPTSRVAEVTGLSRPYCRLIRAGKRIPHPRHWQALAALAVNESNSAWKTL